MIKECIKIDNIFYNIYKFKGLFKNFVGSVSLEVIRVVVFFKKINFLYFVKMLDKKYVFSVIYKEYLKNINFFNNYF